MLQLIPVGVEHIPVLEDWFREEAFLSRLGGFPPVEQQVRYLLENPRQKAWMLQREGRYAGFLK